MRALELGPFPGPAPGTQHPSGAGSRQCVWGEVGGLAHPDPARPSLCALPNAALGMSSHLPASPLSSQELSPGRLIILTATMLSIG